MTHNASHETVMTQIMNELDFTEEERNGFKKCIRAVKDEQKNPGNVNAEKVIEKIIKELAENYEMQLH